MNLNNFFTRGLPLFFIMTSNSYALTAISVEAKILDLAPPGQTQLSIISFKDDDNTVKDNYQNAIFSESNGLVIDLTEGNYSVGFSSYVPENYSGPGTMFLSRTLITNQDGDVILDESFDGWELDSNTIDGDISRSVYSTNSGIEWTTFADTSDFYNGGGTAFDSVIIDSDNSIVYPLDGGGPFSVVISTKIDVPVGTTSIYIDIDWSYNANIFSGENRTFSVGLKNGNIASEFLFSASQQNLPLTISGNPTLSIMADESYSFIPSVNEEGTFIFTIINQPDWADFNTDTGELSGTPSNFDVGITEDISITVINEDNDTSALASFSLSVEPTTDNSSAEPTISSGGGSTGIMSLFIGIIILIQRTKKLFTLKKLINS